MTWRRQVIIPLAGAVLLNALVAFGCGLWSPRTAADGSRPRAKEVLTARYPRLPGAVRCSSSRKKALGRSDELFLAIVTVPNSGEAASLAVHEIRLGWPMHAFAGEHHFGTYLDRHSLRWAVLMPPWAGRTERLLGYRPLPAGFVVDVVVLAVLLWVLLHGSGNLRRYLRTRHARCGDCSYPIGASAVCTECGAPLPERRRVA